MTVSVRIVFFGNERLATGVTTTAPALQALIAAGYDVAAVVSQFELGKSRKPRELEISVIAGQHNIPVLLPHKMSDIADQLADYKADIGVLVAFGKIVPQSIIDIFPHGIINIHPSLLPRHRGSTPIESALLHGDSETGVSLMQLVAAMDAGPVYAQERLALNDNETKQQLADQLLAAGTHMLVSYLPAILNGSLQPQAQDETAATTDSMITKDDAVIDWQKSAKQLEREIRAYAVWPKSRTNLGGQDITITAAHIEQIDGTPGVLWLSGKQFGVHTSDGVLVIDQLVPSGRKPMSGSDFLLGYKPGQ